MRIPVSRCGPITTLLISFLVVPSSLFAQAWLLPKGEGTVSLGYQYVYVRDHAYSKGEALDIGHIHAHGAILDVDYSLTNRMAVIIGLPYTVGNYVGPRPHLLPFDDGLYHGTFQDFRINLRYNLSKRAMMITPFFEAVIPSHSYENLGHVAVGKDLHEYRVGASFGRRLDPVLPNAYFQARYSYAFVERALGIAPNHSDTDFQFGYFLTPRFSLLGLGSWLHTHSGLEFDSTLFHGGLPDIQFLHHNQIGRTSLLDVGGGAGFSLSRSLDMSVSVTHSIRGTNGHLHAVAVAAGLSWSFRTKFAAERTSPGMLTGSAAPAESPHE